MQPHTWLIDFEAGMIPAVRQVFPNALVLGCYYHFEQSLIRWLERPENGLAVLYRDDMEFKILCRQFSALAFVPIDTIRESFDILVQSIPQQYAALLANFVEYVQVPKCLSLTLS